MPGSSINLRSRLQAVADQVPPGHPCADIGSDHGRLPRDLVQRQQVPRCIATERAGGPLQRLRWSIGSSPEGDRIETREGDGLDPLRPADGIETVTICGMGARTILAILQPGRLRELAVKTLVLQPQSEWARIREQLGQRGWEVCVERLVLDRGNFYTVMTARAGGKTGSPLFGLSDAQWYEAGPCWLRDGDPLARRYWQMRLEQATGLAARVTGSGRGRATAAIEFARKVLAGLE